jgi:hypothetical protein
MADPTLLSNLDQTIVYQAENGTAYGAQDRISIQIPPSPTKAFTPSEAYVVCDFQIDTNADISTTKAMFQLNPFTGIHSVIRDQYTYDGAGREVDSVRNYDEFAMATIPYERGQDELALASNQEGITYLSRPNQTPLGFSVENQLKSSYAAELYYQPPLNNTNIVIQEEELPEPYVIAPRTQRFCFPLNTGLWRSNQVFPGGACNGLRLDLLLQSVNKSVGKIYDCASVQGTWKVPVPPVNGYIEILAINNTVNPSVLDLFRRGVGVGCRFVLEFDTGLPSVYYFVANITNIVQTPTGVQIYVDTPATGMPADTTVTIREVAPAQLPSWKITNVQMFVRETEVASEMSEAMKAGATYQFISHYNIPQSMVAGSGNPTVNWNIVPINQCLSLFACPVDEVQRSWGVSTFTSVAGAEPLPPAPALITVLDYGADVQQGCYNQVHYMWSLESSSLRNSTDLSGGQKVSNYQWMIGTELEPSQPDATFMKEVPQYLNYELKNSFASMGRQVYSFKLHSFDNDGIDSSNQAVKLDEAEEFKTLIYHRQFSLALAPSPNLVLSLIDKPVQLRLGTIQNFSHNHTFHLYVNHYRTAVLNPNGTQIVM